MDSLGRPPRPRRRSIAGSIAGLALGLAALLPAAATTSALPRWTGGIDLYRTGTFSTQKTWLWCTAANVQIVRNIVDGRTDHGRSQQAVFFEYMRAHNRYRIPVEDGVDPAGWTAGLRHYVDTRYRLVASTSFTSGLRTAVTNLRKTNLPVGLTVAHGGHAWILTGFTASADPATTASFTVTSVRVTGPLWGLQSRTYGYDMRPDTQLSPSQLRDFFTPWHYAGIRMAWEGRWVSIQPIAGSSAATDAPAESNPATSSASPAASRVAAAPPAPIERLPREIAADSSARPGTGGVGGGAAAGAAGRRVAVAPGEEGAGAGSPAVGEGPIVAILVTVGIGGGMLAAVALVRRRRTLR